MNITDELRECATDWGRDLIGTGGKAVLFNIADRIDAEHISIVDQTRNKAWNEGFDDGYASADDYEAALQERGWIRLKDANGEAIHLGDVMENIHGSVDMVEGILSDRYLVLRDNNWLTIRADLSHHHHEPTVEDVLRQVIACANNGTHVHGALDTEQIIAEYAVKLQLKEPSQ